jgi:hypothetical protein
MSYYIFEYTAGTDQITCSKNGVSLDWIPPINGLTTMAASAKRVFYADLVKDMQADPGVTNSVGVIIQNFEGELGDTNTESIQQIKTLPLASFKGAMKATMSGYGVYVETSNIPKSSTSGTNPKRFSNATDVYYDSGESPSDICINPGVTHLVDSAYCLDPASGTKHEPKRPINYSFKVDTSITEGLFGFPSYYSFTTRPTEPNFCEVIYTLNPQVAGQPPRNFPTGSFDITKKNTVFNSDYSNAEKNKFITRYSTQGDEIIKKLVIKESGDCAQIWSILCELIIRTEESGASNKANEFQTLRERTLLITTDSVVFSRAIPFCSASDNGGREGVLSGCFTQKYFTHGSPDYPLAYTTQMNLEKQRIKDQNDVNRGIFTEMIRFFTTKNSYPYFYRLVDIPGSRRPKKELTYNRDLYDADCIERICRIEIEEIDKLNRQIGAIDPAERSAGVTEDNLKTTLESVFLHMEQNCACRLYFSQDTYGNCMVHDYLHTQIQSCLIPKLRAEGSSSFIGSPGPGSSGVDPIKAEEDVHEEEDEMISDEDDEENNEEFSYYECLVAYMILQKGFRENYASMDEDGTTYIRPSNFLEKYDTFIDEYKREPVGGDRHREVETFLAPVTHAMNSDNIPPAFVDFDIKVRRLGGDCLSVILNGFLVRKHDMRMRGSVALGVDNSVMQLDSSNSSSSSSSSNSNSSNSSNSQRNPFDVGNFASAQSDNRSNNLFSDLDANSNSPAYPFDVGNSDDNLKRPASPIFAAASNNSNQNSYVTPPPNKNSILPFDSQDPGGLSITAITDMDSETTPLLGYKPAAATTAPQSNQSFFGRIFGSKKSGGRRTMKVKKYLKNNRKKTIKKTIKKNKKTLRKTIRKNKKTRKSKA